GCVADGTPLAPPCNIVGPRTRRTDRRAADGCGGASKNVASVAPVAAERRISTRRLGTRARRAEPRTFQWAHRGAAFVRRGGGRCNGTRRTRRCVAAAS